VLDSDLFDIFVGLELHHLPLQILNLSLDLTLDVLARQVGKRHDVDVLEATHKIFGLLNLRRKMLTELIDMNLGLLGL
jgi:hypothetical protein